MTIPVLYTPYVPPSEPRPKIIDADGNEFVLPKTFNIRSEPIAKKQSLMDVAFAHGARDVSDGKMTPRIVEVSGKIWADSDASYNIAWDALAEQIIKENFKLEDRGRRINVWNVQDIQHVYPSLNRYRYGEVSLQFLCLDPFWYAAEQKTKTFNIAISPQIFEFEVLGNIEIYPKIKITPTAPNADLTLEATTDGAKSFRIQDAGALAGTVTTVDCAEGTVSRDGTNVIGKFSGQFLRLLGGRVNRFEYTGAPGQIVLEFYEAWL
jgi:hypothetical protein